MPIHDELLPNEQIVFEYTGTEDEDGYVQRADSDEKCQEFNFAITNARVYIESELTGEVTLPLEDISLVSSGVIPRVKQRGRKINKILLGGFAAISILFLGTAALTDESVLSTAIALAVVGYLVRRLNSWVSDHYTGNYRLLGFSTSGPPGETIAGLNPGFGDRDLDEWDIAVRFPDSEFTPEATENIGDFTVPTGTEEARLYALPKALFGALGLRLIRPDELDDEDEKGTEKAAPHSGGPTGLAGYVCESCGEELNIFSEVREGTTYTCMKCGHELDQQKEIAEQLWDAEEFVD